jgi:hypothetical protein
MHQLKYNNYIPVLLVFFLTGVSCIRKNSEKSTSKNRRRSSLRQEFVKYQNKYV